MGLMHPFLFHKVEGLPILPWCSLFAALNVVECHIEHPIGTVHISFTKVYAVFFHSVNYY